MCHICYSFASQMCKLLEHLILNCLHVRMDFLWYFVPATGVGYVGGRDDGWVEHQQSFDQILASLNAKKEDGILSLLSSLSPLFYLSLKPSQ